MRVLRDVVVDRTDRDELLIISQSPAIRGEGMTLDLVGAGTALELRVKVLESRPIIIEGAVRHRVRLQVIDALQETSLVSTVSAVEPLVSESVLNTSAEVL